MHKSFVCITILPFEVVQKFAFVSHATYLVNNSLCMNIVSGRGDMLVKTDRSGKFCILKRNPAIAQKRKLAKD